jgi:hypothetical protein
MTCPRMTFCMRLWPVDDPSPTAESSLLINAAKTSEPLAPSDIRRILSPSSKRSKLAANVHYLTWAPDGLSASSSDSDDELDGL